MSIKGWMTGKGAQFKKTFRVDKGSGRTSSSSGAKKGNIFVGAKLVEVCDYQNARATVEIIFESALCRTLLENVGWKTMINAAEKIQACHRGGHVRKQRPQRAPPSAAVTMRHASKRLEWMEIRLTQSVFLQPP